MRKLIITRTKKFSGSAATAEIYINDSCYGQLKNGATITLEVDNTRLRVQAISDMLVQGDAYSAAGGKTCKGNVVFIEEGTDDVYLNLDMKSNLSGLLPTLSSGNASSEGKAAKSGKKMNWGVFAVLFIVFFPAAIIYYISKK